MAHVDWDAVKEAAKKRLQKPWELGPGERLRALREANGLTQEKFGDLLDVSDAAVNSWENGPDSEGRGAPQGANPYKIEAWSKRISEELGLPRPATIHPLEWRSEKERATVQALSEGVAAAAPSGAR